jgi:DNA-binding MarR family transcriptional regulator
MTTRQEQVMIHLYRYVRSGECYRMPYGTSQDGIAEAIGIRRSHVSTIMKRMESEGLVRIITGHVVKDSTWSRSRKCYKLNLKGILETRELLKVLEEVA